MKIYGAVCCNGVRSIVKSNGSGDSRTCSLAQLVWQTLMGFSDNGVERNAANSVSVDENVLECVDG